jgi:hypothetical protein
MALSPQANYTDWATAIYRRNLVPTFVDREVSRGLSSSSSIITTQITITSWHNNSQLNTHWMISLDLLLKLF